MRKFFTVFLSFYISSFLIMFSYFAFHDYKNIWMPLGGSLGLSLIATIFFTPVLLVISTLQLLVKEHIKLKYFISFLLMEIHGFLLFIVWPNRGVFGGKVTIDKIIGYFAISILSTIVFLSFFYFIDNKKYLKVVNFLFKKHKQ